MSLRDRVRVKTHGHNLVKKVDSGINIFQGLDQYLKNPAKFGKPPVGDPIWSAVETGETRAPPTNAEPNGEQQKGDRKQPASGRSKRRCVLKRWPEQPSPAPKRRRGAETTPHNPSSPPPVINVSNRSKLFAVRPQPTASAATTTTTTVTTPSKDFEMSRRSATPTRLDAAITMNLLAKGNNFSPISLRAFDIIHSYRLVMDAASLRYEAFATS